MVNSFKRLLQNLGTFLIFGAFLAVSRLVYNDSTSLAETRAQRLRSRETNAADGTQNTLNVDLETASAFLDNDQKNEQSNKDDLLNLYTQLDDLSECNRTLDTPLLRLLLNSSATAMEKNVDDSKTLYLANLIARHTYLSSQCKSL